MVILILNSILSKSYYSFEKIYYELLLLFYIFIIILW